MKFKPLYFNMNHSLRRLAIKNRFVLTLINEFYSLKNSYRFQQIIAENKNLTIFDYKNLIKPIPYAPTIFDYKNLIKPIHRAESTVACPDGIV